LSPGVPFQFVSQETTRLRAIAKSKAHFTQVVLGLPPSNVFGLADSFFHQFLLHRLLVGGSVFSTDARRTLDLRPSELGSPLVVGLAIRRYAHQFAFRLQKSSSV